MEPRKKSVFYKLVWCAVRLFYPPWAIAGDLPQEASIVVGNHSQAHGPIFSQLHFPAERVIWCAGQMLSTKEIPDYAYQDFWCDKPRWSKPFYRLLSFVAAPLAAEVLRNADTIGVYHDSRILGTFKQTIAALQAGKHVIIFPECRRGHNQILCQFQENFVDVARLYYKRTGKELLFVPMYLAPRLRTATFGTPIRYDHTADPAAERTRICAALMDEITRVAEAMPEHIVVPYPNIPKKNYRTNHASEAILP